MVAGIDLPVAVNLPEELVWQLITFAVTAVVVFVAGRLAVVPPAVRVVRSRNPDNRTLPQATRRYLYFARVADIEGYPDIGGLFRDTSEAETGHAFGHLDFLKEVGDPCTNVPIGTTAKNLKSAVEGETYEYTEMYPGFAKTARDEGLPELAEWFETLAKAEKSHAGRFAKGLDTLGS